MLGDVAPWYLPLMFTGVLLWCFAPNLLPWCEERGALALLYKWGPSAMVLGLLLYRANAIFSLDSSHVEVATILTPNATFAEQIQLIFTGQGAIEGAFLCLMLFSLLSPKLPSLRGIEMGHRQAIQQGLMRHTGWWMLLCVILVFPDARYVEPASFPSSSTVSLPSWWNLAAIICFSLLLIMSGEIVASTSLLTTNDSTLLLFRRAVLKLVILLPFAVYFMTQSSVFSDLWWSRPLQDSNHTVALMILVYSLLICFVHAPAAWLESSLGQGGGQSTTMAWGYGIVIAFSFFITIRSVSYVDLFGDGSQTVLVSLRLASFVALASALSMLMPTLGYDSAHRPELWWLRFTLFLIIPAGSLFSVSFWLLIPAVFASGVLTLNIPWLLENHPFETYRKVILAWSVLAGLVLLGGIIFSVSFCALVVISTAILCTNAFFTIFGMQRWSEQTA